MYFMHIVCAVVCCLLNVKRTFSDGSAETAVAASTVKENENIPEEITDKNAHPYVALIDIMFQDYSRRWCSGAIIHNNVVITAAHCFVIRKNKNVGVELALTFVIIGTKKMFDDGYEQYLPIEKILTHPRFDGWTADLSMVYTFAGMISDKPGKILPLAGERLSTPVDSNVTVLSWGQCGEEQSLRTGSLSNDFDGKGEKVSEVKARNRDHSHRLTMLQGNDAEMKTESNQTKILPGSVPDISVIQPEVQSKAQLDVFPESQHMTQSFLQKKRHHRKKNYRPHAGIVENGRRSLVESEGNDAEMKTESSQTEVLPGYIPNIPVIQPHVQLKPQPEIQPEKQPMTRSDVLKKRHSHKETYRHQAVVPKIGITSLAKGNDADMKTESNQTVVQPEVHLKAQPEVQPESQPITQSSTHKRHHRKNTAEPHVIIENRRRSSVGAENYKLTVGAFGFVNVQACKKMVSKAMPLSYQIKNQNEILCFTSEDHYITAEDSGAPALQGGNLVAVTIGGVEVDGDHVAIGMKMSCFCPWIAENIPGDEEKMNCCTNCCDTKHFDHKQAAIADGDTATNNTDVKKKKSREKKLSARNVHGFKNNNDDEDYKLHDTSEKLEISYI